MSTIAQAQDLDAQYKAGNLSASEYKELLEDLRHTAAVNEAAGDLNKLTQIYQVLDGLKSAAKTMAQTAAEKKTEDWMTTKWRPLMAVTYMATIWFDFIVGPILFNVLQYFNPGQAISSYIPITLQGGGLYHISMGAILGIAAWTRGKEKIATIEAGESGK
jgi:hypothetical protein